MRNIATLFASLLLVVACQTSTDDSIEQADRQTPRSADSTPSPEPSPSPTVTVGQTYTHEFEEPVTWEDGGFDIAISAITFRDRENLIDRDSRLADLLEESTSTVLAFDASARNDSGEVANWYPYQGEIVLGNEQVDAHVGFSDSVGDSDWQPGTERAGEIVFELRTPFEDVVNVGEARFLIRSAGPAEIGGDRLSEDADITIEWPTP